MGKCNNKKCKNKKCGSDANTVWCGTENNLWKSDFKILGINYSGLMRICKVLLILFVFVIASYYWASTNDILWQCMWSLSLIKLVELSD